jgi:putative nucleotidyltransferase with HDIG domain
MTVLQSQLQVLFVDDDPLVLQGLQRMLRPMRNQWSMSFVESGAKALEAMEASPFQVVVSDMRMPGMDGAKLLTEIKNRYPKTVRLILSGHADKDLILECVGTAHQFLSKPCEPEALRLAISRASAFGLSVKSDKIKGMIAQMDRIPTIPTVYCEIVEKLRDDSVSIEEIGALIVKDPGITAQLLKLVNSAFFGLCREVSSPSEAVAYLGIETMKALVLGVHAFGSFDGRKLPGFSLESLWSHSLEVGAVARRIMELEGVSRNSAEESFVAGMLHDIGKLVLAVNLPEDYKKTLAISTAERIAVCDAEEQVFGANHADVGGFILSLWGLPARVVEAITYHHNPESSATTAMAPLVAVHVADCAVNLRASLHNESTVREPRVEFLNSLGLQDNVPQWMTLTL